MNNLEKIADVVLKAADSGGLKVYMPYSQQKIIRALEDFFDGEAALEAERESKDSPRIPLDSIMKKEKNDAR